MLHLGKKNQQEIYLMHDHEKTILSYIEKVTEHSDLGASMDKSSSFNKHNSSIILKANKILATIERSFKYITEKTSSLLNKSLVCPHLEYCNTVWNPNFVKHVKEIERVQRWDTNLVPSLKSLPYEDRLKRLNLPTLKYHRKRGDILLVFKLINQSSDILQHSQNRPTGDRWLKF